MLAEFISPDDPRWSDLLRDTPHDVYHTPSYLLHAARHEEGHPTAFYGEHNGARLLVPLLVRPLPETLDAPSSWQDAATPYGYGGPLFSASENMGRPIEPTPLAAGPTGGASSGAAAGANAQSTSLWRAFRETASESNLVTAFLRWHPFFPPPATTPPLEDEVRVYHGQTVYLDLTEANSELEKQVRHGHRYEIRRLSREGFSVVMNEWSHYPRFIKMYEETMRRVGAGDSYFFSSTYFHEIKERLADRLHLGGVFSSDGELVSAALFTETCGVVQYHLSATASQFLRKSPAKLLLSEVRTWAKGRGNHSFHLGGGLGGAEDRLFQFKAGFSPRRAGFHTSRIILNSSRYLDLVKPSRTQKTGSPAVPANRADYFPKYRQAS